MNLPWPCCTFVVAAITALSGCNVVSVSGPPVLSIEPASVAFGAVGLDTQTTAEVTLINAGGTALQISSISVTGEQASSFSHLAAPTQVVSGARAQLQVTFHPTKSGLHTAQLTIETNVAQMNRVTVALSGSVGPTADGGARDGGPSTGTSNDAGASDGGGTGSSDAGANDAGTADPGTIDGGAGDSGSMSADDGGTSTGADASIQSDAGPANDGGTPMACVSGPVAAGATCASVSSKQCSGTDVLECQRVDGGCSAWVRVLECSTSGYECTGSACGCNANPGPVIYIDPTTSVGGSVPTGSYAPSCRYASLSKAMQTTRPAFDGGGSFVWMGSTLPQPWAAQSAVTVGTRRTPTAGNGHQYDVVSAGTTGAAEPVWPTGSSATVTDGTVTWVEAGNTGPLTETLSTSLDLQAGYTLISSGCVSNADAPPCDPRAYVLRVPFDDFPSVSTPFTVGAQSGLVGFTVIASSSQKPVKTLIGGSATRLKRLSLDYVNTDGGESPSCTQTVAITMHARLVAEDISAGHIMLDLRQGGSVRRYLSGDDANPGCAIGIITQAPIEVEDSVFRRANSGLTSSGWPASIVRSSFNGTRYAVYYSPPAGAADAGLILTDVTMNGVDNPLTLTPSGAAGVSLSMKNVVVRHSGQFIASYLSRENDGGLAVFAAKSTCADNVVYACPNSTQWASFARGFGTPGTPSAGVPHVIIADIAWPATPTIGTNIKMNAPLDSSNLSLGTSCAPPLDAGC